MYLADIFTLPINIAGIPSISVPAGFVEGPAEEQLPVGMQLMARPFDEESLFRVAHAYEQATGWGATKPDL